MNTTPMHFFALVVADGANAAPDLAAVAAARALADQSGATARALIIGSDCNAIAELAMPIGLDEILLACEPPDTQPPQSQQIVDQLVELLGSGEVHQGLTDNVLFLVSADPLHEEVAARLAARLGATPLGRLQTAGYDAVHGVTGVRSAYGGRLRATQRISQGPAIASVRSGAAASPAANASARKPTAVRSVAIPVATRAVFEVAGCSPAERHAPVDSAKIVVSGGRGVGDAAGFDLLYEIALRIGGAVGASLPAVDAGHAPVARQVGQSGKYVRPDIYLAVGISGTPQHMAGIDPHTRVVAINSDPEAPIFSMSRVGIIGDWKEILPELRRTLDE